MSNVKTRWGYTGYNAGVTNKYFSTVSFNCLNVFFSILTQRQSLESILGLFQI